MAELLAQDLGLTSEQGREGVEGFLVHLAVAPDEALLRALCTAAVIHTSLPEADRSQTTASDSCHPDTPAWRTAPAGGLAAQSPIKLITSALAESLPLVGRVLHVADPSPPGRRHAQPRPQGLLQARMADVQFDVIPVPEL